MSKLPQIYGTCGCHWVTQEIRIVEFLAQISVNADFRRNTGRIRKILGQVARNVRRIQEALGSQPREDPDSGTKRPDHGKPGSRHAYANTGNFVSHLARSN